MSWDLIQIQAVACLLLLQLEYYVENLSISSSHSVSNLVVEVVVVVVVVE